MRHRGVATAPDGCGFARVDHCPDEAGFGGEVARRKRHVCVKAVPISLWVCGCADPRRDGQGPDAEHAADKQVEDKASDEQAREDDDALTHEEVYVGREAKLRGGERGGGSKGAGFPFHLRAGHFDTLTL